MWSGAIANIPVNYHICDGNDGTPNLLNLFIVGAGDAYAVGDTGGESAHTLTELEIPSHKHVISRGGFSAGPPYAVLPASSPTVKPNTYPSTEYTGGSGSHENRPPFYALAYIMKVT